MTDASGEWAAALDGQTGQLEKANDRTIGSIQIVEACDKRDAETVKQLTRKPWWRRLF